jgi:dihydroorotate dehydrogenase (fumarate)
MDLTTTYMGLKLNNPIVPSASPLTKDLNNIKKMEDAGAGAIVMHSLFEEQIIAEAHHLDHYLDLGTESFAEALSYFPQADAYIVGPEQYLSLISRAKAAVSIPIIASLNGVSDGGWTDYARKIQQAGADALELNIYTIPTDPAVTAEMVEKNYLDVLKTVKSAISIPVAIKMNPYFSATANMAKQLADNGANGLVLFNRFYQPDLDLENLEVLPHLQLSTSAEMSLPLRWLAILYGRVPADLALSTGVHTAHDVMKGLMAGANVTMMTSELLQNGIGRIKQILNDMTAWMDENEYESIAQMRGSMSQKNVANPATFVRANYMKTLLSYAK